MEQLFSICGRGKRNIYHVSKRTMFKSFANKRQKHQPQVNSRKGWHRQHSGATSCFHRPTDHVLVMSSCLWMTGISTIVLLNSLPTLGY